ncbi:patatin-like phospholipase family protein [Variovorax sp. PCZ-1]|uniref:patatin-like phospholipase family protein n=1 Tax=Variovorax sp. PCZ-1 TaxID=2835533 RepID=UPI001BCDC214|nr:patatin-like phospholipase family protein [Variovorax sp. PCZ-1]MBS7807982.1 patatin-like phospholipase family protein [Variovorax sp. PCZ-1]
MTLSTLIHAGLVRPTKPRTALVLMGGGARTAYQAGALKALGQMLSSAQPQGAPAPKMPFQLLVGTSAGALNASFLAAHAAQGLPALDALAAFWRDLRSHQVYRLDVPAWTKLSRIATAWHLSRQIRESGALLDNLPLADTLHKAISLQGIDDALSAKALHALAVTASSYSSGVHWTFCHTARDASQEVWNRPGRRAEFQPITMDHLMASSAIPLIFPAQPLWVDGHSEFFGDGSMRQTSPLSPALHLGADKLLVIGVGQPQRSSFGGAMNAHHSKQKSPIAGYEPAQSAPQLISPGVGGVLGHALASVFHDTLLGDVEQAQRMNHTLDQLPREVAAVMPYRRVQVMSLQPSESLDELARQSAYALPAPVRSVLASLAGKAAAGGSAGAGLASYLLFEPAFTQALIALGERDAYARKEELMAFLAA